MARMVCFEQLHHTRLRFTIPPGRFMLLGICCRCIVVIIIGAVILFRRRPPRLKHGVGLSVFVLRRCVARDARMRDARTHPAPRLRGARRAAVCCAAGAAPLQDHHQTPAPALELELALGAPGPVLLAIAGHSLRRGRFLLVLKTYMEHALFETAPSL